MLQFVTFRRVEMRLSLKKDIDYSYYYEEYKKIPMYIAILNALAFFAWSIIDVCVFQVTSYDSVKYGILGIESAFLEILVWWIIGAIITLLNFFLATIFMSPTVMRTDSLIYLENQKRKEARDKREEERMYRLENK